MTFELLSMDRHFTKIQTWLRACSLVSSCKKEKLGLGLARLLLGYLCVSSNVNSMYWIAAVVAFTNVSDATTTKPWQ